MLVLQDRGYTKLEESIVSNEEDYYVYKVLLKGEVIYVGKGKGRRSRHVLSGKSHNFKLNEYYFRHTLLDEPCPVVKKVKFFKEEDKALQYETYLIKDLLPDCNIMLKSTSSEKVKPTKKKSRTKVKRKPQSPSKQELPSPEEVVLQEKEFLLEVPEDYEGFKLYMEELYQEYLNLSVAKIPHTLKWFCYSKKEAARWSKFVTFLDRIFEEQDAIEKANPIPTGRKKGFPLLLNFSVKERNAFYRMKKKIGLDLKAHIEEDFKFVEQWLTEYRRRPSKKKKT